MTSSPPRKPQIGRCTDVGRIRQNNEDNMGDIAVPNGHALIVADGMGGYRGGALASRLVVESIEEYFRDAPLSQPRKTLRQAIFLANERVYLRGRQDKELSRMGSTCVVALVQGRNVYTAHVGDSRIYLMRKGNKLQQITRDHTVVQHFVDVGLLSPEDAEGHPDSHILSRALGPRPHVEAELNDELIVLDEGDRLLLCSDGLTKMMSDGEIEDFLGMDVPMQELADMYVQRANELGGEDNITVLLFEYYPAEPEEETTPPMPLSPVNPEIQEETSNTLEFSADDVVKHIQLEENQIRISTQGQNNTEDDAELDSEEKDSPTESEPE